MSKKNYPVKVLERDSKKNGITYTWYFYYYDADGRHMKSKSGYLNYEDCFNQGLIAYNQYVDKGILSSNENDKKSMDDVYDLMMRDYDYQSPASKKDMRLRYKNHIKDTLGKRFIKTIKISELQDLVLYWNKNTYNSTYIRNCVLLRKLYTTARRHRLINENLTDLLVYPHGSNKTLKKTKMPTTEDLELFKKYINDMIPKANKDKKHSTAAYEFRGHLLAFDLGLVTGARISEIYGLDWEHVNFEKMQFEFRQSYDYMFKIMNTEMKNQYSRRDCPFDESTKEKLLVWKEETIQTFGKLPVSLLTRMDGDRLDPRTIQNHLKNFNKKFDKNLSFHQLRHFFTTVNAIDNSADITTLQEFIGHASGSSITQDVYTHLSDEKKRELLAKYMEHIKPLLEDI